MAGAGEFSGRQTCVRWFFVLCNIPILALAYMLLGIEYSLIPEKPALGKAGWNPGLKSMFNMHLFGLATLGIGIWQIVEEDRLEEVLSERYTVGGAIFVAAGAITIFVSILGILGAARKYKYALLLYLAILFLIVALEIVVFGYAIAKADDIDDDQIRMDLLNALDRYYPSNSSTGDYDEDLNDVVDFIQETLECCGVNNTGDWLTAPYFEETNSLPSSCCDGEPQECLPNDAYDKGCREALADYIQDNLYLLVGIAIAFAVFEVAMLVMSFYLFMAINNSYQGYEKA